MQMFNCHTN